MDEPFGKDEDLALLDGFGDEDVGGGDEPHIQFPFQYEHHLGGAWVRVRRVEAAGGVVDAGEGDAQGVEARDLLHVGGGDQRPDGVVGGAGLSQAVEEEIFRRHVQRLARKSVHLYSCVGLKFHTYTHSTN